MNGTDAELCYRRASVQQATSAGLAVILYDMLVGDLRRAVVAMRDGAIEVRSQYLKHAFSILELLEGFLDRQQNGSSVRSLSQFYGLLRKQILTAQFELDDRLLEKQIALILDVREAWQRANAEAVMQSRDASAKTVVPESASVECDMTATSQWFA